jgi:hypothetical protein
MRRGRKRLRVFGEHRRGPNVQGLNSRAIVSLILADYSFSPVFGVAGIFYYKALVNAHLRSGLSPSILGVPRKAIWPRNQNR